MEGEAVWRLSMTVMWWPCFRRERQRCEPRKPAPPVTRILRGLVFLVIIYIEWENNRKKGKNPRIKLSSLAFLRVIGRVGV